MENTVIRAFSKKYVDKIISGSVDKLNAERAIATCQEDSKERGVGVEEQTTVSDHQRAGMKGGIHAPAAPEVQQIPITEAQKIINQRYWDMAGTRSYTYVTKVDTKGLDTKGVTKTMVPRTGARPARVTPAKTKRNVFERLFDSVLERNVKTRVSCIEYGDATSNAPQSKARKKVWSCRNILCCMCTTAVEPVDD